MSEQQRTVWWITDDALERGGEKLWGPFLTSEQAEAARTVIERREGREPYWVCPEHITVDAFLDLTAVLGAVR